MKTNQLLSLSTAAMLVITLGIASHPTVSVAASSEIKDLGSKLSARVAREKIKQRSPRRGKTRNSNSDCGKVDIGNDNSGGSARGRINPRDNTVIVTGPIINAANCR